MSILRELDTKHVLWYPIRQRQQKAGLLIHHRRDSRTAGYAADASHRSTDIPINWVRDKHRGEMQAAG